MQNSILSLALSAALWATYAPAFAQNPQVRTPFTKRQVFGLGVGNFYEYESWRRASQSAWTFDAITILDKYDRNDTLFVVQARFRCEWRVGAWRDTLVNAYPQPDSALIVPGYYCDSVSMEPMADAIGRLCYDAGLPCWLDSAFTVRIADSCLFEQTYFASYAPGFGMPAYQFVDGSQRYPFDEGFVLRYYKSVRGAECGAYVNGALFMGVNELAQAEVPLILYPNPAHGQALVATANGDEIEEVELWDALGRQTATWRGLRAAQWEIPLQGLSAGMYVVRVKSGAGIGWRRLVVE